MLNKIKRSSEVSIGDASNCLLSPGGLFLERREIPGVSSSLALPKKKKARCHFCTASNCLMELLESQEIHLLLFPFKELHVFQTIYTVLFFPPGFVVLSNLPCFFTCFLCCKLMGCPSTSAMAR